MTSTQRQSATEATSQGFRIWARHSPQTWGTEAKTIHLAATAIDLPPTLASRRDAMRLVLVKGVVMAAQGRTEFVAARLIRRITGDGCMVRDIAGHFSWREEDMTDKELSEFGGKLYEAVLFTPLPAATVFSLALAVRQAIPWSHLPQHLKFAVFKIAASCTSEAQVDVPATSASDSSSASAPGSGNEQSHDAKGDATGAEGQVREEFAAASHASTPVGDGEATAA